MLRAVVLAREALDVRLHGDGPHGRRKLKTCSREPRGHQISGAPRRRRDVVSVAASARWRGVDSHRQAQLAYRRSWAFANAVDKATTLVVDVYLALGKPTLPKQARDLPRAGGPRPKSSERHVSRSPSLKLARGRRPTSRALLLTHRPSSELAGPARNRPVNSSTERPIARNFGVQVRYPFPS